MAGELLVRVLKYNDYKKALSRGPINNEIESEIYLDKNNWDMLEFKGEWWVLLDNADFSNAAWDVIDSVCELPALRGFEFRETCPQLVTGAVLKTWEKKLSEVLSGKKEKPVVLELSKALYELVRVAEDNSSLCLTVEGLL